MKQNFSSDSSTLDTEFGFNSSKLIWPYGLKCRNNRKIKCQSVVHGLNAGISTRIRVKIVVAWFGDYRTAHAVPCAFLFSLRAPFLEKFLEALKKWSDRINVCHIHIKIRI